MLSSVIVLAHVTSMRLSSPSWYSAARLARTPRAPLYAASFSTGGAREPRPVANSPERALCVLAALLNACDSRPQMYYVERLEKLLRAGGSIDVRASLDATGAVVLDLPRPARGCTFLTAHFGSHRVLTLETAHADSDEPVPPRSFTIGGLQYELVCSKAGTSPKKVPLDTLVRTASRGTQQAAIVSRATEPVAWHYVATRGAALPALNLPTELQRVGDFASVQPMSKQVARLELLCSRAPTAALAQRVPSDLLRLLPDNSPPAAGGAAMSDGCGFAPDSLVDSFARRAGVLDVRSVSALQVRVFSAQHGVFKGMLLRRPGIDRVQLRPSMRKVLPALARGVPVPADVLPTGLGAAEALVLVKLVHPSRANRERFAPAQILPNGVRGGERATAAQQPGAVPAGAGAGIFPVPGPRPLSPMVRHLWRALGLSPQALAAYEARCAPGTPPAQVPHASLSGVADPFASLPTGSVFAPGVPGERMFVTRFPCVRPADGRVLPLVTTKPPSLTEEQWAWLRALPFGTLIFSVRGARPLPEVCGGGDLDGDLYFCCWDEQFVLPALTTRPALAAAEPVPPARPAGTPSAAPAEPAVSGLDLGRVHEHLTNPAIVQAPRQIGRLFRLWEKVVARSPTGMDDPDALALANAYLQALKAGKHGGDISLPQHLLRELNRAPRWRRPGMSRPTSGPAGLSGSPVTPDAYASTGGSTSGGLGATRPPHRAASSRSSSRIGQQEQWPARTASDPSHRGQPSSDS